MTGNGWMWSQRVRWRSWRRRLYAAPRRHGDRRRRARATAGVRATPAVRIGGLPAAEAGHCSRLRVARAASDLPGPMAARVQGPAGPRAAGSSLPAAWPALSCSSPTSNDRL